MLSASLIVRSMTDWSVILKRPSPRYGMDAPVFSVKEGIIKISVFHVKKDFTDAVYVSGRLTAFQAFVKKCKSDKS